MLPNHNSSMIYQKLKKYFATCKVGKTLGKKLLR